MQVRHPTAFVALLAPLLLSACGESVAEAPATAPPPPTVKTLALATEDVSLERTYPGRVVPVRLAEVRARVSGIVLAKTFMEGGGVRAGEVLFEIDPAKFAAAVDAARAQVTRAEASLALAAQQEERAERLTQSNIASRGQYDVVFAGRKQAEAELAVAMANLRTAELELGYASVRSPIDGRVGAALVTEGAFVRQEDGTQMATVRDLSTVYVDFTVPLADVDQLRGEMAAGGDGPADDTSPIDLIGGDGCPVGAPGRLLFSSVDVDETTGQVSLRAEFPNPRGALLPGTYVRVRMPIATVPQALPVPTRAVQWDTLGQSRVTLVSGGRTELRQVTTGATVVNRTLITAGLEAGDEIAVDGSDRIPPGSPVTAERAAASGGEAAGAACGSDGRS